MAHRNPSQSRVDAMKVALPNALTLFGLCLGLTSVRLSMEGEWELAVCAILSAALLDFFDGFVARMLKATSQLGVELDSLSDLICFGVAPAFLLYRWTLYEGGWLGWCVALLYCSCAALRLARFNTQALSQGDSPGPSPIFRGVPAPSAAGLTLVPLYLSFQLEWPTPPTPLLPGTLMVLVAFLMVTTLPTFSLKKITVRKDNRAPFLIIGLAAFGLFILFPWVVLSIACFTYILSIPLSVLKYNKNGATPFSQGEIPASR